jgi:hypothetical protein
VSTTAHPLRNSRDPDQPHWSGHARCGCKAEPWAIPADDNSIAVMLDFVNPVGADRRLWSFNRLSRYDEPGREMIDFHCQEKIG